MRNYTLYRSLDIIRVIKFKRMRWAGHVARMVEGKRASKFLQVNLH